MAFLGGNRKARPAHGVAIYENLTRPQRLETGNTAQRGGLAAAAGAEQAGNVASVDRTDEKLIASINPSKGRTPTLGRERGFFDELFNNIGTIRQPGLPGSQGQ